MLNIINDLIYINRSTAKKAANLFAKNWALIFTGIVYTIINIVLIWFVSIFFRGILSIFGGLAIAIAMSAMLSNYLYLLNNIVKRGRFSLADFKEGFGAYLWKIYGVFFIAWVVGFLFDMAIYPLLGRVLPMRFGPIITLLVFIIFNALPESIYLKYYSSWESILYAFNFIKENWLEWFLPNILFVVIIYFITGKFVSDIFSVNINFNFLSAGLVRYLLSQVILSYAMIYRGVLFELLSTSTRRKRMYMRDLYK